MKIDVHTHYFPPEYIDEVERHSGGAAHVTRDAHGQALLHYAGDYNVIAPGHISLEQRLQDMDRASVDMQIITMTTPGTHVEEPKRGLELAQLANDALAKAAHDHPERLRAMATLPLQDPAGSVQEFERAVRDLGLRGAMVFSNVNGTPLWDRRYWPLYEKAAELDAPILVHPTTPANFQGEDTYRLVPLIGFCTDTTMAAAGLVFEGLYEEFPNIKIILSHLGGALPYLAERIERGWVAYAECKVHLKSNPVEHFKRMYLDTVSFDPNALMCAAGFSGADHLMLGSDYPHQIGDLNRCVPAIEALPLSDDDKERIFERNARELFGI